MSAEPLRISVEIASSLEHCWYGRQARIRNAPIIDSRVRPLVDLLRECRSGVYYEHLKTKIDAALKDAGVE